VNAAALDASSQSSATPLSLEPADRRFLRAVTIDLTGRSPLPSEWKAALGRPRAQLVRELAASLAAWEGFYEEELFYFLLIDVFRPSTDAFVALPKMLAEGKASVRDALLRIASSQFFNARNPGNDTFVTVVLEQLLGVTVQKEPATLEAGKKLYDGYPGLFLGQKGSSQADVVRIAVADEGFEPFFVGRKFAAIFGDAPPRKRLAADAARLRSDPFCWPAIVTEWLSSQAYEELLARPRAKSDRVFVRALFADLLGRPPEYQEFRRCRNALLALSDSRPLRSVVVKTLLDSELVAIPEGWAKDPAGFVSDRFLQLLARAPTQQELEPFVRELERSANPRLLLRALLTHAEYQTY
jgi:hypothetical protein